MEIVTGRPPFACAELLTPPYPAGTAVQATLLIDGMLFEMDAVAARGGVRRAQ